METPRWVWPSRWLHRLVRCSWWSCHEQHMGWMINDHPMGKPRRTAMSCESLWKWIDDHPMGNWAIYSIFDHGTHQLKAPESLGFHIPPQTTGRTRKILGAVTWVLESYTRPYWVNSRFPENQSGLGPYPQFLSTTPVDNVQSLQNVLRLFSTIKKRLISQLGEITEGHTNVVDYITPTFLLVHATAPSALKSFSWRLEVKPSNTRKAKMRA